MFFHKISEEELATLKKDYYLPLKYSLLGEYTIGVTTEEGMKEAEEKVDELLEKSFSGEGLLKYKPKIEGLDLTEYLEKVLLLDVFEELAIIVVSEDGNEVLDFKKFTDTSTTKCGSVLLNREITNYLISSINRYGLGIGVVCAHNHPGCVNAVPSNSDYKYALMLSNVCRFIGIEFLDMMVVTRYDVYSAIQDNKELIKRTKKLSKKDLETLDQIDLKLRHLWDTIQY